MVLYEEVRNIGEVCEDMQDMYEDSITAVRGMMDWGVGLHQ